MTRFRSFVVANVLLAVFAFALIANDWRKDDDTRTRLRASDSELSSPADLAASTRQMLATTGARVVELRTLTATSAYCASQAGASRPNRSRRSPDLT